MFFSGNRFFIAYAVETGFFAAGLFADNRLADGKRSSGIRKAGRPAPFGGFVGKQEQTDFCNAV